MLVTSRESRRWVIPKGNQESGMAPHAAAAAEAEEEAGVCGQVCPTPLGSYRYRKKRGSGASLMIDVDVFPMVVTRELVVIGGLISATLLTLFVLPTLYARSGGWRGPPEHEPAS